MNQYSFLIFFTSNLIAQPAITQQPTNQSVAVGQTETFSVTATSDNPITYQWFKDSAIITGANSASYTTPPSVFNH